MSYICWVEFPFHVLYSSSLLWSQWIPPSFFTDETSPETLWCTAELPWKKISKKDWHVSLWRKEFRCCSWLWIWQIINIILAMFFLSKKKPYDPKFTKSNILITAHWKQQSKTRDHLCFICKLWSLNISLETPVE